MRSRKINNITYYTPDIPFYAIIKYLKLLAFARFGETREWNGIQPNNKTFNGYIDMLVGIPTHDWSQIRYFTRMLVVNELRSLVLTGECDVELLQKIKVMDKDFWIGTIWHNTIHTKLLSAPKSN